MGSLLVRIAQSERRRSGARGYPRVPGSLLYSWSLFVEPRMLRSARQCWQMQQRPLSLLHPPSLTRRIAWRPIPPPFKCRSGASPVLNECGLAPLRNLHKVEFSQLYSNARGAKPRDHQSTNRMWAWAWRWAFCFSTTTWVGASWFASQRAHKWTTRQGDAKSSGSIASSRAWASSAA